jgi:hypothetical protein
VSATNSDPRLERVPPRDSEGHYVMSAEVEIDLPGYGRLLPMINVFRRDKRYRIRERNYQSGMSQMGIPALKVVSIYGPYTPDDIEHVFVLPPDLRFRRLDVYHTTISDPELPPDSFGMAEVMLKFHPPRSRWWQSRRPWEEIKLR